MNKLVSIIIPTYNRARLIGETLNSILQQTYPNWEIIVVDDGSSDSTQKVLKSYLQDDRIKYYHRPENRPGGGNAARNFGFEKAKGSFVKWLDSDDLLTSKCLEKQLADIEKSKADVSFCRSKFFVQRTEDSELIVKNYWHPTFPHDKNYLENFILGKIRFSNNDGLWRRDFLNGRPYEENLKNSQEFVMISLALAGGASVSLQNEVLVLIREHEGRMKAGRAYADFVHNQCLARFFVIKGLKKNKIERPYIYRSLVKTMAYYILTQIKKKEFPHLSSNLRLFSKALYLSLNHKRF